MLALPLASGLLYSGGPLHASRGARPAVRMLSGTPLDFEELQALAGTWNAHLNLEEGFDGRMERSLGQPGEDGGRCLTLHLEARALEFGGHRTPLHTTDETVSAQKNLAWEASEVGTKPDDQRHLTPSSRVEVRLVMGAWVLEGTGKRKGLRLRKLRGRVLRGANPNPHPNPNTNTNTNTNPHPHPHPHP